MGVEGSAASGSLTSTPVVEGFINRGSDTGQILVSRPPKLGPSQISDPQPVGT